MAILIGLLLPAVQKVRAAASLFGDGSVRFVTENVQIDVYVVMLTRAGNEIVNGE